MRVFWNLERKAELATAFHLVILRAEKKNSDQVYIGIEARVNVKFIVTCDF